MLSSWMKTPRSRLRLIALAEGTSYVLLLLIAMPLKYYWGQDWAVKYTGWAHGVLFIMYAFLGLHAIFYYRWPFSRMAYVVAAAFVPGLSFVLDATLRQEQLAENAK